MSDLTTEQLSLALAVVAGVALLALVFAAALFFRLRKLSKQFKVVRGSGEDTDLLTTMSRWARDLDSHGKRLDSTIADLRKEVAARRLGIQRFHVVRYDAFEEMGGRLSFSAALLDEHGDGLVITSINGRTESRTYSKPIKNLTSEHNLSEEERDAISKAMSGSGRGDRRPRKQEEAREVVDDRSPTA